MKLFRKRDTLVLLGGFVAVQILAALLINRFMFHPFRGGYDKLMTGYVNIGTNGCELSAVVLGPERGKKAVIYCHGNAEDISVVQGRFSALTAAGYTVAAMEYPGYGQTEGSPTEDGCYENAHRLYDWLVGERGFRPEDIVVVGYSIGTGVAVELAVSRRVSGLWLEAPYMSAPRVVTRKRILLVDPFPSCTRIARIGCPLLVMHGTSDWIVPYSQGRALFDVAQEPKRFVSVEGAGHTDFIEKLGSEEYDRMLLAFVGGE